MCTRAVPVAELLSVYPAPLFYVCFSSSCHSSPQVIYYQNTHRKTTIRISTANNRTKAQMITLAPGHNVLSKFG